MYKWIPWKNHFSVVYIQFYYFLTCNYNPQFTTFFKNCECYCLALKLSFSREKLYSKFHYLKLFLPQTHEKLKNSNFFQVFLQIFEIHIIRKIIPKYMDSVISTGWEKMSWHMLLSFSKMNVPSLTSGSSNPLLKKSAL